MIFVAMRTLCLVVLALALCGGYFFASVLGDSDNLSMLDFSESIPGDPEKDYPPFLDKIPQTAFTCQGKSDGFYADVETHCQVFHVCSNNPDADPIQSSYLCPNGTIFNQESIVCQWWPDVKCPSS